MNLEDYELSFLWLMVKQHDELLHRIKPDDIHYRYIKISMIQILEQLHDYHTPDKDMR